jgi:hypothetical protein
MPSQIATAADAEVIDFGTARERQLLIRYRGRAQDVIAQNRQALQELYDSGMIFTRHGTKVGRDLLQAHRNLLRIVDMLKKAPKCEENGVIGRLVAGEALFVEVEALLAKTNDITQRNKSAFRSNGGF